MAPPRFEHLQAAVGGSPPQSFPEEEAPTNKLRQMLGRVETQQKPIPTTRGVEEHHGENAHTDHAVRRSPKSTQLGLAPAFEMLPQDALDGQKTMPLPRKPTPPPPPPESRKPTTPPMFRPDDDFEPEMARMLEGPATLLAPAPTSHGMPAWIQILLLVALLTGVGVAGWLLWARSNSGTEPVADAAAEGAKGPLTGPVNGLEAAEDDAPAPVAQEPKAVRAEPEVKPAKPKPARKEPVALAIPTQNLPRDPAKASDVLVHRALPLIRRGELALAEATLDRA